MKEIKELVTFVLSLVEAFAISLEDKKFSFSDLQHFMEPIKNAIPAFQDITKIREEMAAMDDAKMLEFVAFVKADFDIVDDKLEEKIESAFVILIGILKLMETFKK